MRNALIPKASGVLCPSRYSSPSGMSRYANSALLATYMDVLLRWCAGTRPSARQIVSTFPRLRVFGLVVLLHALLATACLKVEHQSPVQSRQCTACHGDANRTVDVDAGGVDAGLSYLKVVLQAAPPLDLNGNRDPTFRGVGAHQNHLTASATHDAVRCADCHVIPDPNKNSIFNNGHFDSSTGAQITFGSDSKARWNNSNPTYDVNTATCNNTYCHHSYAPTNEPKWQAPRNPEDTCGSCHGAPPDAPHPQNKDCSRCHGDGFDANGKFVNRSLHLNGKIDIEGSKCNTCHGTDDNGGPPPDLEGNTTSDHAGVGAHQNHLQESATHKPVACESCHVVPDKVEDHAPFDAGPPATITFSGLANNNNSKPAYDSTTQQCSGTYCHGGYQPTWTAPRESKDACGSCHDLPPPAPHPQNKTCSRCHSQVIDANQNFVDKSLHVNGAVDIGKDCNSCHGTDKSGGPPTDLEGNTTSDFAGVGAHQNHLQASGTHDAVPCESCHAVPEDIDSHRAFDAGPPASITFGGLSTHDKSTPAYDSTKRQCSGTYCHGGYQPNWTNPRDSTGACGSCHGLPPPAPHPQNANCSHCHAAVIDADRNFVNKSLHIDGVVEKGTDCNSCHGTDKNGGPPPDLEGNTTSDFAGVGAHQNHLQASVTHDAIPCNSCHVVPADIDSHRPFDAGPPATITFGGLSTNDNSTPAYDSAKHQCSGTYCHGGYQPNWTTPRDSTGACGSCHGLPPPAPHPQNTDCSRCHSQVIDANRNFVNKSLHINGVVNLSTACNGCHGTDPTGGPPPDLEGNTTSDKPGVGAHQNHLQASATHATVPCNSCHVVPADVNAPGHIDSPLPAEITFGGLSTSNNSTPIYDASTHKCSNTYCHQSIVPTNNPIWQQPRDSTAACGSCHGLPPPAPHPQKTDCSTCHSQVIDSNRNFVNVALHVDGTVQVTPQCNSCHGTAADGSPPPDLSGNIDPSSPGVGAHQRHLQSAATHGPVACNQCHVVPSVWNTPGHFDGSPPAAVTFGSLATLNNSPASFSPTNFTCTNVYCHLSAVPNWIAQRTDSATCGTCHGLPPPFVAGVAISAQSHPKNAECSRCHGAVIDQNMNFTAPNEHVNGTINVVTLACNSCHGSSASPAPPTDLSGNTDVTAIGVGAHQAHLNGGPYYRPVPCGECHVVPTNVNDPGHINDWTTAEVTFSGAAIATNRIPTWNRQTGSCTNVWCHSPQALGNVAPIWNDPNVSINCATCHGFPPPPPHDQTPQCNFCHTNYTTAGTFKDPSLHVNGTVDF